MNVFKYYVDVVTMIFKDGLLQPMAVVWMDRRYKVDKVISVRETHSKAGGSGICYRCQFAGQERNLFWERNRWFLESEAFIPEMLERTR